MPFKQFFEGMGDKKEQEVSKSKPIGEKIDANKVTPFAEISKTFSGKESRREERNQSRSNLLEEESNTKEWRDSLPLTHRKTLGRPGTDFSESHKDGTDC